MTVTGLYVGYGISLKPSELLTHLKLTDDIIKTITRQKTNKQPLHHDLERDCGYINTFLRKYPITENGVKFDIVNYPHRHPKYDEQKIVFGHFIMLEEDFPLYCKNAEAELKQLFGQNIDYDKFEQTFGQRPQFMIVANDCHCCS